MTVESSPADGGSEDQCSELGNATERLKSDGESGGGGGKMT